MLPAQNILYLRISSWSWELWEKQHDVTSDHTIKREWGDEMCTEERNYIKWMKDESCQHFPGRMERLRKRERKRGGEGEWWLSWLVENWIRLIRHNLASHQTWQPGRGEPLEHKSTLICLFFTSVCRLVSLLSCLNLKLMPTTNNCSFTFLSNRSESRGSVVCLVLTLGLSVFDRPGNLNLMYVRTLLAFV